jgi:hypothetical protein
MSIMARALKIRKEAATTWNCKVSEICLSCCLKQAHAENTMPVYRKYNAAVDAVSVNDVGNAIVNHGTDFASGWEIGLTKGKHRVGGLSLKGSTKSLT